MRADWLVACCLFAFSHQIFAEDDNSTDSPTSSSAGVSTVCENTETTNVASVCGTSTKAKFTINEEMENPLCLVFNAKEDSGDEDSCIATNYTLFYPTVDEFTLIELSSPTGTNGGFGTSDPKDERQRMIRQLKLEAGGVTSNWKTRFEPKLGGSYSVVPFYTLIIEMKNGKIKAMTWDDAGCWGCEASECLNDMDCSVDSRTCGKAITTDDDKDIEEPPVTNCNVKVYVGWFGTDANGRYSTSAGKRLSRFRKYSLATAYDSALSSVDGLAKSIGNAFTGNNNDD